MCNVPKRTNEIDVCFWCTHKFTMTRLHKGQMVLTVNMEGGGGAALSKVIFSFDGVFSTVARGGVAYLQTEHVLGTADANV